ncbi:glycosyltransferase family 2 protein [Celeribacter arenosi]|uniref:Glycosyl transferase family 2 n=1 Tax=Celeribacter arenosi TaxID=792649 RepID=A0ABP7K021_9RHOB
MKFCVGATVRNEGPFILEWLAWQKMLGFDDVIFVHNDCTDHSVEMMKLLAEAGFCHELEHFPAENQAPVRSGLIALHTHPVVAQTDWFFLCDVDEYLIAKRGDGTVQGLVGDMHERFRGISVQWRCFGTSGLETWEDRPLHRMFTLAADEKDPANKFYKSFAFRPAENFKMISAHEPRGWRGKGKWGEGPNRWAHISDRPMNYDPNGPERKLTKAKWISLAGAQVNHYVTKTLENFTYKAGTPCPARNFYFDRYNERFFLAHNRNEVTDTSALAFDDRFDAVMAQLLAVKGVLRLHHLCCADLLSRMHEKAGSDVKSDPRYSHHLEMAAAQA